MIHHDEDEAIRRGVEGANFFGYSLGHYYVFGTHRPGRTDVWSEYTQRRAAQGFDPDAVARAVRRSGSGPRSRPATRPGCAAASARRSRPGSTCGATRRPASTR